MIPCYKEFELTSKFLPSFKDPNLAFMGIDPTLIIIIRLPSVWLTPSPALLIHWPLRGTVFVAFSANRLEWMKSPLHLQLHFSRRQSPTNSCQNRSEALKVLNYSEKTFPAKNFLSAVNEPPPICNSLLSKEGGITGSKVKHCFIGPCVFHRTPG